jgi:protein-S-isoprenylcysteine O-methyltransferase Ste14
MRWLALVAVLGTLGISGYYRYRARQGGAVLRRSQEPLKMRLGRLAIALPLFGSILLFLARPRWMDWAALPLPGWARWLGVGFALVAIPSALWVFRSLGRNVSETILTRPDQVLVTTGPYRWVRHPLYATGGMLFLGTGLAAGNWFILLCAAVAVGLIGLVVIPAEERALEARFGDAYARYATGTGRLLPRLARRA